jgi:hypothetical protein
MSNVVLNILSEFKGKKAFKEADTAIVRLEKNAKKLGSTLGLTLGTAAVVAFGKASVKAFAADQVAAVRLAGAVKNLGLEFANPYITDYISNLEKTSKIADDQLRPAFQRLLQQTGSIAKSQSILNTSIEVSRGSAVDLATVTEDLARAYYGNTRSLKKYSLGLTDAELKAKSFNEIQGILDGKFKGSSKSYLSTYAGQIDALSLSFNNLKEKAGQALFILASGGSGNTATGAKNLGGVIDAFGTGLIEAAKLFSNAANAFAQAYFGAKSNAAAPQDLSKVPHGTPGQELFQKSVANDAKLKAIEKQQALLYKQQLDSQKKLTAEQKKQAALKKDGTIFDMQQIQLVAALKGKLSADEENRVKLQLALLNENQTEADRLTKQILMAQDSTGKLYSYFQQTPDAKNPFGYLDTWIKDFQTKLNALQFPIPATTGTYTPAGLAPELAAIGVAAGYGDYAASVANQASSSLGNGLYGMQSVPSASSSAGTTVNNYFGGNVVTDQSLIDLIMNGTQLRSLSGSPSQIGRIAGMFG